MKSLLLHVAGCLACLTLAQAAPVEITYWDFFGGGDGIRMKQIVEEFNKSQQEIRVTQTTLTWGEPFYTKVHTAVVAGQTPDVMSYHLSHFPAGIAAKDLRPITAEELSQAGLKESDFQQSVVERSREAARSLDKAKNSSAFHSISTRSSSTTIRPFCRKPVRWTQRANRSDSRTLMHSRKCSAK